MANNKPTLTVIAGCNGSGKSSFSKAFVESGSKSFDYDLVYLGIYNDMRDSELRERIAHQNAREVLQREVRESIENRSDFVYETNFNSTPLYWPEIFKENNFRTRLVYFCLDSISEAKMRVRIRVENGGHFVPDNEVESRFELGYKYLNKHWEFFDEVHLFNTSFYKSVPKHIISIKNIEVVEISEIPEFLITLLPDFPFNK